MLASQSWNGEYKEYLSGREQYARHGAIAAGQPLPDEGDNERKGEQCGLDAMYFWIKASIAWFPLSNSIEPARGRNEAEVHVRDA